ncbi:hypothetical protein C8Q77DRAFT_683882 [Trametes polyzona]|nr:hypothetical protein C8Q77DRAFT_683882 [Trametes polyzona]
MAWSTTAFHPNPHHVNRYVPLTSTGRASTVSDLKPCERERRARLSERSHGVQWSMCPRYVSYPQFCRAYSQLNIQSDPRRRFRHTPIEIRTVRGRSRGSRRLFGRRRSRRPRFPCKLQDYGLLLPNTSPFARLGWSGLVWSGLVRSGLVIGIFALLVAALTAHLVLFVARRLPCCSPRVRVLTCPLPPHILYLNTYPHAYYDPMTLITSPARHL